MVVERIRFSTPTFGEPRASNKKSNPLRSLVLYKKLLFFRAIKKATSVANLYGRCERY